METLNISEAKAQLSRVVEKVSSTGEEVILTRAGKPVAKVTPYTGPTKRIFGLHKGRIWIADDWKEWPEEEARALGIID